MKFDQYRHISVLLFNSAILGLTGYIRQNRTDSDKYYTVTDEINVLTAKREQALNALATLVDHLNCYDENLYSDLNEIIDESEKVTNFTVNKCDEFIAARYSMLYDKSLNCYLPRKR